jgi:hypothetical protein
MKDPVGVCGCWRGFSFWDRSRLAHQQPCDQDLPAHRFAQEPITRLRTYLSSGFFPEEGFADARLAGNSAQRDRLRRVYRHRKVSQGAPRKIAGSLRFARLIRNVRLVGLVRLARCPDQPVSLDQHMAVVRLRPERKADDDEGGAKQQPHHHHASVGRSIRVMK